MEGLCRGFHFGVVKYDLTQGPISSAPEPVCRIEVGAVTQSAFATASVDQPASCLGKGGEWRGRRIRFDLVSELLTEGTNRR